MAGSEEIFKKAMNDGHSAAWDQNWSLAARAYMRALDQFPDSPKALSSYALALYELQNFDEALRAYIRCARVSPEDPLAFEKISRINALKGLTKDSIQAALYAAELYLKLRDVDKALENWLHVIQLNPENLQARTRLALVHEKTGQIRQASIDYIAVASILQNNGNPQKALEILNHAAELDPGSLELQQALKMVSGGKILPKPVRPKSTTAPLVMKSDPNQLPAPQEIMLESPDPVIEARQKALKVFADVLFDTEDDGGGTIERRVLADIEQKSVQLDLRQGDHSEINHHLGEAINAQTKEKEAAALNELEQAVSAGFTHPAAYFEMGLIQSELNQAEPALKNLQHSLKHTDYAMASRLLSGKILRGLKRESQASIEYLEALKIADVSAVPADQVESLLQLYEPLTESAAHQQDPAAQAKLCENVEGMLMRANWRQHLMKLRSEMPNSDGQSLPLAEIIIQAQSSEVIQAMKSVNDLARSNHLRSALDEAFYALTIAPTYLPLHTLIADLLIQDGRKADAVTKLGVIANAYNVRSEPTQATAVLKRVIQLSPMDLTSRNRLIGLLTERGQVNEAISEYLDLADIYYRLAELEMARKSFAAALQLTAQPDANPGWKAKILHRMADIDLQRLDWRQAVQVYEQLRTLSPDDINIRENLVGLHLRLAEDNQARAELNSIIDILEKDRPEAALAFLKKQVDDQPGQIILRQVYAEQLFEQGQESEAIAQLDLAGDQLMEAGDIPGLKTVINQILLMNPPNAERYRALLLKLQLSK